MKKMTAKKLKPVKPELLNRTSQIMEGPLINIGEQSDSH